MVGLVTIDFGTVKTLLLSMDHGRLLGVQPLLKILGHLCPQVIAGGNCGVDITLQK